MWNSAYDWRFLLHNSAQDNNISLSLTPFRALTMLTGWQKDIQTVKYPYHLPPKILFWNKWQKKTKSKPAIQVHLGNGHLNVGGLTWLSGRMSTAHAVSSKARAQPAV